MSVFILVFSFYAINKISPQFFYYFTPMPYRFFSSIGFLISSTLFPHNFINIKNINKTLRSKNFRLELLEPRHFPDYIEAFSHRVKNFLDMDPSLNDNNITTWLNFEITKQNYGRKITYVAITNKNQLLGSISISKVPLQEHGQILGWLNEKHWGSGTTQETIRLALKEFFRVSGETESNAFIEPHNVRCYKALKKMGFEPAGRAGSPSNPGPYILKITADTIKKLDKKNHDAFKSNRADNNLEGYSHKIIADLDLESNDRQSQTT